MVSSDLWTYIDSKSGEIFIMIPEKNFVGLSVMSVPNLLELPPIREKFVSSKFFDKDSMTHLLGLQLQHLLKYAELTEFVRQNDKLFIDLHHKVRVDNIDDDVEKLLKERFRHESDEDCSKEALHMYAENEPTMKRNKAVLNDLTDKP